MSDSSVQQKSPVIFKRQDSARLIYLNRPNQRNALDKAMVNLMIPQLEVIFILFWYLLKAWQYSDLVKVVILMSQPGSKAFCAGGDVKSKHTID